MASWPDEAPGDGNVSPDEGARLQLEARRHHDVYDRLPQLAMPVLVACGRYDDIAPPSNSEAIVSQVPGAVLEVFEGGHMFMIQDRAAFPRMAAFLGGAA